MFDTKLLNKKEKYLFITEKAEEFLNKKTKNNALFVLKISVKSGGCAGFQYELTANICSLSERESVLSYAAWEDFSKNQRQTSDLEWIQIDPDWPIWVDPVSLELIQGSTLDFTESLLGSKLILSHNPQADRSCGCKSSFSVKF